MPASKRAARTSPSFTDLPEALEIHRRGAGLLPGLGEPAAALPIWVQLDAKSPPLRLCGCAACKRKKRTCDRVKQLSELLAPLADELAAGVWEERFERAIWIQVARQLAGDLPVLCGDVRVRQFEPRGEEPAALQFLDSRGAELARYFDTAPQRMVLLERLGKAPEGAHRCDRSGVLERLMMYQRSQQEHLFAKAGMPSRRQRWESGFWFRLAYHCLRHFGDLVAGDRVAASQLRCRPAIDRETGDFHVEVRREEVLLLRAAVPRTRVQSALSILSGAFPGQEDLELHPIPLKTIFRITLDTEVDVELRPEIRWLQETGEETYLRRPDLERFKYGRLLFVPELDLLAELEDARQPRKFAAPASVRLRRSQVPSFLDEHRDDLAAGHLLLDEPLKDLQIYQDIDRVELSCPADDGRHEGGRRDAHDDFPVELHLCLGGQRQPAAQVLEAYRRGLPHFDAANGWIDLRAERLAFLDLLPDADDDGLFRLPARELLRLRGAVGRQRIDIQGDRRTLVAALLDQTPPTPYETPVGFRSELRNYQRLGVDWLRSLASHDLGGLLCDDMGLGKTHQAMALMAYVAAEDAAEIAVPTRFLVVCPTSVLGHWHEKLQAFAPGLAAHLYHGGERRLPRPSKRKPQVIITSYGILRNDRTQLADVQWRGIFFDEIQYLKNQQTRRYEAATLLSSRFKIGLTGTPIENHLEELKNLFDLVLPGYLGTAADFRRRFVSPPDPLSQPARRAADRGAAALRRLVSPFVLRRGKSAVLDELPEKIEDLRSCGLSSEQQKLYAQALHQRAEPLRGRIRDASQPIPYLHVFAVLTLLKQICDHPCLARREIDSPSALEAGRSGKWDLFVELLHDCLDSGLKVVVFSQFLGMLDLMSRHLAARGVDHGRLDGGVAAKDRTARIERFNREESCRVFLASLKAGGTGVDLVGGSVVIHYDRWWNAAREDQATGRVHRLGQNRAVQVFKLVTAGTLEEKIARLIDHKRELMAEVVPEDDARLGKIFTRDELLELMQPVG